MNFNQKLHPEISKRADMDLDFTVTDSPYEKHYLDELYYELGKMAPKINEAYKKAEAIDPDVPDDIRKARQGTMIRDEIDKVQEIGERHMVKLQVRADKELSKAQNIEIPDFNKNVHGPRASEIRNHLWSLSMPERTQVLTTAAKQGNEEVLLATLQDPFMREFLPKERFDQIKDSFYSLHRETQMKEAENFKNLVQAAQHRTSAIIRSLNKVAMGGIK